MTASEDKNQTREIWVRRKGSGNFRKLKNN